MGYIAIIDTETNWRNEVMSIGVVVSHTDSYEYIDGKYCIFKPEVDIGGMYSDRLKLKRNDQFDFHKFVSSRSSIIAEILDILESYNINEIFAYNALFDYQHLWELRDFHWFDIMRLASNRNHNSLIPFFVDWYKTGKMKRGYGVEKMIRLMTSDYAYSETHNAIYDAIDELMIMKLMNQGIETYHRHAKIN